MVSSELFDETTGVILCLFVYILRIQFAKFGIIAELCYGNVSFPEISGVFKTDLNVGRNYVYNFVFSTKTESGSFAV